MKVIFAIGNPGPEYTNSRHNAGFKIIDEYAEKHRASWSTKPKLFSEIAKIGHLNQKLLLVKPTTFYNGVGQAARALADFYKLTPADFLIIHDDLALPFGQIRTRSSGSSAGNNGLKSLQAHLGVGTWRIRIGSSNPQHSKQDDSKFVLSGFSRNEQLHFEQKVIPASLELINQFTIHGSLSPTTINTSATPQVNE